MVTVATNSAAPAEAGAAEVEQEIASLASLDLHQLRSRWRTLLRSAPPPNLPRPLLMRLLAYRVQARAFGDLDRETVRYLDRLARDHARQRRQGEGRSKSPPAVAAVPLRHWLKPGTLLVREHGGEMHAVTVTEQGFAWRGSTHGSLSEIARLITGTNWSGPRFFGLRDEAGRAGR